jgi:hypothetical protein
VALGCAGAAALGCGASTLGPTIPLEPSPPNQHAEIAGRVTDVAGRPVPNASLSVAPRPAPVPGSGASLTGYTGLTGAADADGRFAVRVQRAVPATPSVADTVRAVVRVGPVVGGDSVTVLLRFAPLAAPAPVAPADVVVRTPG